MLLNIKMIWTFSTMSAKEIATLLSYVCSYSEWFGLAELGYRVGEFREFDGKEIILYSWANAGTSYSLSRQTM